MAFVGNNLSAGAVKMLEALKKDDAQLFAPDTLRSIDENQDFALKLNEYASRFIV